MPTNSNKTKRANDELINILDPEKSKCTECGRWYPNENMIPLSVTVDPEEGERILCEGCADNIINEWKEK